MASNWFTSGLMKFFAGVTGAVNFLSDTIKAYLVATSYTPNVDHDFFNDVTEIGAVTGYTPGYNSGSHPTLASKTISADDTNNKIVFDAADPVFGSPGVGETVKGWATYTPKTSGADSPVHSFTDCPDTPTNGAQLTGQFDATDGIGKIQL